MWEAGTGHHVVFTKLACEPQKPNFLSRSVEQYFEVLVHSETFPKNIFAFFLIANHRSDLQFVETPEESKLGIFTLI